MYFSWPGEGIVPRDVDELYGVEGPGLIDSVGTRCFVPVVDVFSRGGTSLDFSYPKDIPSSPCSYLIFSDIGSRIVSAPISNIASTSSRAP